MEKHRDMEGHGEKAMDTNTGGSPGYLSHSIPIAWKLTLVTYSVEGIVHWTPTGCTLAHGCTMQYQLENLWRG